MLTGNKGEWSEVYTLLKLLGEGKLHKGDLHLERVPNFFYPIVNIIRHELDKRIDFVIDRDAVNVSFGDTELTISAQRFIEESEWMFEEIKTKKGAFSLPRTENFINSVGCFSIKAKSSVKSDIQITIHDIRTSMQHLLGFSIKSQLGSPSTLLNASGATNFKYKISGVTLTDEQIEEINAIGGGSKIRNRMERIHELGGEISYHSVDSPKFMNNLVLIDSLLPNIMGEVVYYHFTTNLTKFSDLVELLREENPLNYDIQHSHNFYEYKLKRLLTDSALGMMPSKVWTGEYDSTGGYLVVKHDGEILSYHIYDKGEFENYLFHNIKTESPSSTKHGYGVVYREGEELFIKLNLQLRFTS